MPSRNAILDMLYKGTTTIEQFNWDSMTTVPLLCLMTPDDIEYIRKLITSPRYSGNNRLKMEKIDEVMHFRGFSRFAGGTNRLVYTHPSAPNAVFKVAIDSVGINDNPAEFKNQQFLKPYCCKVFECSPCGTIASFEKVERITTFEEFYSIADDVFYLLSRVILGKYVMEDIGIDYFMNYGIRRGHSPVILDFPYLFELDGAKLECSSQCDDGSICRGEIDYDHGFNKLVCKKCGRVYRARDLAKPPENGGILLRSNGGRHMKINLMRGDTVVKSIDTSAEHEYLSKSNHEIKKSKPGINIVLTGKAVDINGAVRYDRKANKVVVEDRSIKPLAENKVTISQPVKKEIEYINVNLNSKTSEDKPQAINTTTSNAIKVKVTGLESGSSETEQKTPEVKVVEEKTLLQKITGVSDEKTEVSPIETSDSDLDIKVNLTSEETKSEETSTTAEEILDNPDMLPATPEDIENNKNLIAAVTFGDDDPDTEEDLKSAEEALGDGGLEEGESSEVAEVVDQEQPKENAVEDLAEPEGEDEQEEEENDFVVAYDLPSIDEASCGTIYFVAKNRDIDISAYDDEVINSSIVDPTLFDAYAAMSDEDDTHMEYVKLEYVDGYGWQIADEEDDTVSTPAFTDMGDGGAPIDGDHFDEDDLIKRIQKSAYKDSLKDYAYDEQ